MLNVIIVDDEPLVTSMLEDLIDWQAEDMALAGIFRNGEEAWRYLQAGSVDVAIIDMTMPVMDGIALLKRMKLEGCRAVPIVLSSYQDFHLVRTAFMSGAVNYLLKNDLNGGLLKQVLSRQAESLNTKQTRYDFIASRLKRGLGGVAGCIVAAVSWDNPIPRGEMVRILDELAVPCVRAVFYYEQTLYSVLEDTGEPVPDIFRRYMATVFPPSFPARMNMGFSPLAPIRDLGRAVLEADESLANNRFFGEYANHNADEPATSMGQIKVELSKRIRSLDIEGLSAYLRSIADRPCQLGGMKQSVIVRLCQMLDYTFDHLSDIGIIDHIVYDHNDLSCKMSGCPGYGEIHAMLVTLIDEIEEAFCSIRENNVVFFIKVYTKYNYDRYIDMRILAKLLYMSPATLGRIFYRETGVHYKEYLNNVRIRQAAVLLSRSSMQVSKVAFQTGFQNAEHFSREFKKIMGISPAVFRTQSPTR